MEGVPYKAGVGSLMYAVVATRANIAFAVNMVSQFMSKAVPPHWMVVKRIMRYLKGTLDFKLCLGHKNFVFRIFCDARWTGDAKDRQSTMGYVYFVGVRDILWKFKKQPTIALSTMEAEYMAISHCTKGAVWLWQFLVDVGYVQERPTIKDA